jgi:hypothetical protein
MSTRKPKSILELEQRKKQQSKNNMNSVEIELKEYFIKK